VARDRPLRPVGPEAPAGSQTRLRATTPRTDEMIELLIAACLASGPCRDFSQLYDARDVSLMTCIVAGQAEIARWQQSHPDWTVQRWTCGIPQERELDA
jgi:hypothetical protein